MLRARVGVPLQPLIAGAVRLWRRTGLRRMRLVAVTGSFGKSAAVHATIAALGSGTQRYAGNNTQSLSHLSLLRMRPGRRFAVIELNVNGPGQIAPQVEILRPDIGIVTGIGSEHITSFRTLDNTAREKAELIRSLPPEGLAALNGDDPRTRAMAGDAPCRVVMFGLDASNDFRAENVAMDWPRGTRFDLVWNRGRIAGWIPLLGKPAVYAALAAAAVALSEGEAPDIVAARLRDVAHGPGRLQPVELPNGACILRDTHKGPLESFDLALDTLSEIPAGRRIALLGEIAESVPADRYESYRRLGRKAAGIVDILIVHGHRNTAQKIRVGARDGGLDKDRVIHVNNDIQQCIALLKGMIQPGDVLLLKGRGEARLERIALALSGREVRCALRQCTIRCGPCDDCSLLERGWRGLARPREAVE